MSVLESHAAVSDAPPGERSEAVKVPSDQFWFGEATAFGERLGSTYPHHLASQGLDALGCLGLAALERGQLRAAQALAEEGLEIARCRGWAHGPRVIVVNLVLAMVHLERHRPADAGRLLDACPRAGRAGPDATDLAVHVVHARLLIAVGHLARARAVLQGVRASRSGLPAVLSRWLAFTEAELDLAAGQASSVSGQARSMLQDVGRSAERVRVVHARAELARGNVKEADRILAAVRGTSKNPVVCAEAWTVTALAADRLRNDHRALMAMGDALAIAETEDLRRPFLEFGDRVESIIRHRQQLSPDLGQFVTSLLAQIDSSRAAVSASTVPTDLLTDREQMVLCHMATLQTNEDIAVDLCISVNTVKAHAKSLYRKLAVAKRREAVARARQIGLI